MLLIAALLAALPVASPPQAVSNPFTKNAPAARVPRKRAPVTAPAVRRHDPLVASTMPTVRPRALRVLRR